MSNQTPEAPAASEPAVQTESSTATTSQTTNRPATDDPPSAENLRKVADYKVLDSKGEAHTFKSIYEGPDCARRVLVIFIRHFFCGSCQEFIRALSHSLNPADLARLPNTKSIAIIGCGDPGLIDHYVTETGCPFPIYADPSRNLCDDLGMVMTLAMGARPEYFRKSMLRLVGESFVQGLKHISSGLVTKAGDSRQNGGEFLFDVAGDGEDKEVVWCHRMASTRDHSDIPVLRRVLNMEKDVSQEV